VAEVTVSVPRMLTSFTDGKRRFTVDAETVAGAFAAAEKIYPMLRVHIFDEAGGVREHVQIFVNATDSRDMSSLEAPVSEGDEIIVLQAISGGVLLSRM
jgi:sulfur-carrier protein